MSEKLPDEIHDEMVRVINLVAPLFAKIKRDTKESGVVQCPVCGTGKLHWRVAGRKRGIAAKCETKDCVALME